MARSHPAYDPEHPADPSPPTFWNRVRCLFYGHSLHLDYFDDINARAHLLCMRCSLILVAQYPRANVGNSDTVKQY